MLESFKFNVVENNADKQTTTTCKEIMLRWFNYVFIIGTIGSFVGSYVYLFQNNNLDKCIIGMSLGALCMVGFVFTCIFRKKFETDSRK